MKKLAITLCALMTCSVMSVCAETIQKIIPVGCPVKEPCAVEKPCAPTCNCSCSQEELAVKRQEFIDKRCCLYKKLGLSQQQVLQATCVDEKFFEEMHPLKECCKIEKAKLKDMECKKACESDIKAQKEKVRDLQKQIKAKKKAWKESFMCILNECQKKEYKKMLKDKKKCGHKVECDCDCK